MKRSTVLNLLLWTGLILVTLVAPAGGRWSSAIAARSAAQPDPPIDFELRDLQGKAVKLSQFRGHPIVLDFWATWCPPCRKQIPELKSLYSRFAKSDGLVVIGVACDTVQGDGTEAVAPFVSKLKINYPIVMASEPVVDSLGVEAIPTTLFVGPDGRLFGKILGAGRPGELTEGVKQLLEAARKGTPGHHEDNNAVDI